MHLIVALRLLSQSHAKAGIERPHAHGRPRGRLIDTNVDRLHPALKNIIAYHQRKGDLPPLRSGEVLEPDEKGRGRLVRTSDCRLYWCLIDSELPVSFWEGQDEVEMVIPYDEFQAFTQSIRGRVGGLYLDACDQFAQRLSAKSHKPIAYIPPRIPSAQPIAQQALAS